MCRTRERGRAKKDRETERERETKKRKERERERERKCPREEQGKTTLPTPPLRPATLCLPDRTQCNSLSTHVLSILPLFFSISSTFINSLNFSRRPLLRKIRNVALAARRSIVCIFSTVFSTSLNLSQPASFFSISLPPSQLLNFSELFSTALVEEKSNMLLCLCRQEHCLHFSQQFSRLFSTSLNTPFFLNQPSFSQPITQERRYSLVLL